MNSLIKKLSIFYPIIVFVVFIFPTNFVSAFNKQDKSLLDSTENMINRQEDTGEKEPKKKKKNYIFDGRLGLGLVNWIVPNTGLDLFKSKIDPYFMKRAEVDFANLYGFELGLNYLSSSLLNFAGFQQEKEVISKEEEFARSIAVDIQRSVLKGWEVRSSTKFSEFTGKVGIKKGATYAGKAVDFMPYYDLGGNIYILKVGKDMTWQTTMQDTEVLLIQSKSRGTYSGFGIRYISYQAPIVYSMTDIERAFVVSDVQLLNFVYEFNYGIDFSKSVWAEISIPVIVGFNHVETGFFKAPSGFSLRNASLSSIGKFSLNYKNKRLSVKLLFEYAYFHNLFTGFAKLKKTLYRDINEDGHPTNPQEAGTRISYDGSRAEAILGYYLLLSYRI
jgi:hypothetical protein